MFTPQSWINSIWNIFSFAAGLWGSERKASAPGSCASHCWRFSCATIQCPHCMNRPGLRLKIDANQASTPKKSSIKNLLQLSDSLVQTIGMVGQRLTAVNIPLTLRQRFLEPCMKRAAAKVRRRRFLMTIALPYLSLRAVRCDDETTHQQTSVKYIC